MWGNLFAIEMGELANLACVTKVLKFALKGPLTLCPKQCAAEPAHCLAEVAKGHNPILQGFTAAIYDGMLGTPSARSLT